MKLQPVNYTKLNNKNTSSNQDKNNNVAKNNPSFGNLGTGLASFIETQGFMGEFLTNDLFGMMGPRIFQGYGRNKEELGHLNYKAGREETIRELLSGPAYFYVPGAVLAASSFLAGKSASVGTKSLDAFEPIMKNVNKNFKNADIKEKFINKLTEEAFVGFNNETDKIDVIKKTMSDFADKKIKEKKAHKIVSEALTKLNKANNKFANNTSLVSISGKEIKITTLTTDVKNYLTDFKKKMSTTTGTNENAAIRKIHKHFKNLRRVSSILAIGALSAFLVVIPKLYKTGDKFPGKDGLVTDTQDGNGKPQEAVNENK